MKTCRILLPLLPFVLTAVAAAGQGHPAGADSGSAPAPPGLGLPRGTDADEDDAAHKFLQHRMAEARKLDRKKRMVDTANRLVALSKQLQDDLKGRAATPEDEKRLDEIARLARQVKDQMRQ